MTENNTSDTVGEEPTVAATGPDSKGSDGAGETAKPDEETQNPKEPSAESMDDLGIVIVDDDIEIDKEKINEERRAYLEEARSQDAFD